MKYVAAIVIAAGLLTGVCFAADKEIPKNPKDKESYSLGYQFGRFVKAQGLDISTDVYSRGLKDALAGTKPPWSEEEINETVLTVQRRVADARQKELKAMGEKNLAEGKAFLEANKKKEGVKTLASGLQYKVLVEGSGKSPKATDEVTVNYKGTLIDNTEFDSSYKRGTPATFQLNKVIPGWTEALQLMKAGSKWQLFVPSSLAYGERAAGSIPPNSVLIFEVELIGIK